MDMLIPVLAATSTITWLAANSANIAWAAIGLGMVIFFHELGHFAVAKWCNVNVERFSIGFGPILLSRKWGETEYALSLIPFGGYVKMLGQDDADPSQLTNEEIAQDPRSYLAKNVFQRMAIISAGVTMNVITAILFVGGAFAMGVEMPPGVIGDVFPGMPAWKAGMKADDTIERINGRHILTFQDVHQNVALSASPLLIEGYHHDKTPFRIEIQPEKGSSLPRIGVLPTRSLQVWNDPKGKFPHVSPGTPAANAEPPFARGDKITAINGAPVTTYWEMRQQLAKKAEPEVKVDVVRTNGTKAEIVVRNNFFRTLGLSMDAGPIGAIQKGSPAETALLQDGDKLAMVNGKKVGTEINPLKLPNLFASLHGQDVEVKVTRQPKEGGPKEVSIVVRPLDLPGWTDQPVMEGEPISIPSIGVCFHTIPVVLAVEPDSPADQMGIKLKQGSITKVKRMELILPAGIEKDDYKERVLTIEFDDPNKEAVSNNWGYAFWKMQELPQRNVRLIIIEEQKEHPVDLIPQLDPEWPLPVITGLSMYPLHIELKAKTLGDAWDMSTNYTRNSAMNIYMTLRSLVTGRVSPRELRGPIGIAQAAVEVADVGFPQLLLFLGFLSINLAVLNFLPIPVLDGGHMVFLMWEAVLRRRPSEKVMIGATYAGMAFLLSLMAFVLFLDVFVHSSKK
jgi:regulator of sigma E protease